MLGEPVPRAVFDVERDATLGRGGGVVERVLDFREAKVDDFGDGGGGEGVEDDYFVEAVELKRWAGISISSSTVCVCGSRKGSAPIREDTLTRPSARRSPSPAPLPYRPRE